MTSSYLSGADLPDHDRLQEADLLDGDLQLLERLVVEDLPRLLRVGHDRSRPGSRRTARRAPGRARSAAAVATEAATGSAGTTGAATTSAVGGGASAAERRGAGEDAGPARRRDQGAQAPAEPPLDAGAGLMPQRLAPQTAPRTALHAATPIFAPALAISCAASK